MNPATLNGFYHLKHRISHNAKVLLFAHVPVLALCALSLGVGLLHGGVGEETHGHGSQPNSDANWSELVASMDKMHMAMGAIKRSGNSDIDFVRLMLPHHQAAIDMAKTQLLYGKDPQMRRLAQEIITDQQLEIELMQRWLKQQEPGSAKENQTPPLTPERIIKNENDPLVLVFLFIAMRNGTTSALGAARHSDLQSRPRLRC